MTRLNDRKSTLGMMRRLAELRVSGSFTTKEVDFARHPLKEQLHRRERPLFRSVVGDCDA
jgi:hypothetical protein